MRGEQQMREFDSRRISRSIAIGIAGAALALAYRYYRDRCLFEWDGVVNPLVGPSMLGAILTLFIWLRLRGRLVMMGALLIAAILMPHVDTLKAGAAQSLAVADLRVISKQLEAHRAADSRRGYPDHVDANLPKRSARLYTFTYKPAPVKEGGTVESYTIAADPIRESCGLRHFLLTSGGVIYATTQQRPATTSDSTL